MKKEENILEESYSPLSDADYDALRERGASEEEIETIKDALAIAATVEKLPKNPTKFFDKIDKYFPDDPAEAMAKAFKLPEEDPDFFVEIMAYSEVLKAIQEPVENTSSVEKVSVETIKESEAADRRAELNEDVKDLLVAYINLSPEEKQNVRDRLNKGEID